MEFGPWKQYSHVSSPRQTKGRSPAGIAAHRESATLHGAHGPLLLISIGGIVVPHKIMDPIEGVGKHAGLMPTAIAKSEE